MINMIESLMKELIEINISSKKALRGTEGCMIFRPFDKNKFLLKRDIRKNDRTY